MACTEFESEALGRTRSVEHPCLQRHLVSRLEFYRDNERCDHFVFSSTLVGTRR